MVLSTVKLDLRFGLPVFLCIGTVSAISFCVATAEENRNGKNGPPIEQVTPAPQSKPYLGLNIADLDPTLTGPLARLGTNGQGILVEGVFPDSPAAVAGIRELDILMTYDDQKLFSRNQLVKLIAMDQPGQEVAIRLIREGKQTLKNVRLGDRSPNLGAPQLRDEPLPRSFPQFDAPDWITRKPPRHAPVSATRTSWEQFESLTIKRLENDRFRATLNHFDANRKLIKHEYEGTRDELRKLIDADLELKPNEHQHLLRSLDMTEYPNPQDLFPDDEDPES